jgi:hypothetical protein
MEPDAEEENAKEEKAKKKDEDYVIFPFILFYL